MRTPELFQQRWQECQAFIKRHQKPVWFLAKADDYCYSVVEPAPGDIAPGTQASLYDVDLTVKRIIKSSRSC